MEQQMLHLTTNITLSLVNDLMSIIYTAVHSKIKINNNKRKIILFDFYF